MGQEKGLTEYIFLLVCIYVCVCARTPWMLEKSAGFSTPGHQDKDKVSLVQPFIISLL